MKPVFLFATLIPLLVLVPSLSAALTAGNVNTSASDQQLKDACQNVKNILENRSLPSDEYANGVISYNSRCQSVTGALAASLATTHLPGTNESCDISNPNSPCAKQFHLTPAMCAMAKLFNLTMPKTTNLTTIAQRFVVQGFLQGCAKK